MCNLDVDFDQHIAPCGSVYVRSPICDGTNIFDNEHKTAVRCCSNCEKGGQWMYKPTCGIWVTSYINNECEKSRTYTEARCLCAQEGGRLCTEAEIEGRCTSGSGCGIDHLNVWTSSTVGPSSLPSLMPSTSIIPSQFPSLSPSKSSNVPSSLPSLMPSTSIIPSQFPSLSPSKSNVPSSLPSLMPQSPSLSPSKSS